MRLGYINKINFKKLKTYPGKSLFLILPVILLMALGIVISSQAHNILNASEEAIFGTAAASGRLIELSNQQASTSSGGGDQRMQMMFNGNSEYTESDQDAIAAIENVDTAALTVSVPISQAVSDGLFSGESTSISGLRTLNESVAAQYTDQDFSYQEGQPIPIILNARSFIRTYEDWNGQDEVTIDIGGLRRGGDPSDKASIENQSPIKSEAISYDKNSLIGKGITVSFGGLDPLQDYEQEFTGSGILFRKLTDEQIQAQKDERRSAIEPYWDYDVLNTPLTYTFKVVGVLEDEQSFASFIPDSFVSSLMSDYIQHQLNARTDTELSTDLLNSTFYGMTYDGTELQSSGFEGFGRFIGGGPGGSGGAIAVGSEDTSQTTNYTIPGLVIETERQEGDADAFQRRMFGSTADAQGVVTDAGVFDESVHTSDTLLIKINDIASRSQVVKDLNDAGYAYQDVNDQEVFTELQDTMQNVTTIATIAFIVLTALIVVLTMSKFVSESRKEIGIFRAIGATKKDVKQLFILQAVGYTFVGYVAGVVGGVLLVLLLAKPIQLWFEAFLERTVGETFAVVQQTSAGVFTHIDWKMLGLYTALLFIIALVISIIPATQASRVSPVQAMKNE